MGTTMAERVRLFVRQIETAQQAIDAANTDKTELFKAAKQQGLSPKVLKRVVTERRRDPADREQNDALFQQYWEMVNSPVDKPEGKAHAAACTRGVPVSRETPDPRQIELEDVIADREVA
jgi:uncharacterized protein (UPF0335 family)